MSMDGSDPPRPTPDTANPLEGLGTAWRLLRGALRRRWRVAIICFVTTLALTAVALIWAPREYLVEARILTNPGYLIPSLAHPQRSVPREAQSATRGSTEQLKSRDSLMALVDTSDLLRHWRATRTPLGRFLDGVRELFGGPISDADLHEALVQLLDKKLMGRIDNDSIVVGVTWHDPATALLLVDTAVKNFLDTRRQRELAEIGETITILDRSVVEAAPALASAATALERTLAKTGRGERRPRLPARPRDPAQRDRNQLELDLAETRRAIQTLDSRYQEQLQHARTDLQSVQTTLGPQHPDVAGAVREVERASIPPQELTGLRTEEANLLNRLNGLDRRATPESSAPALAAIEIDADRATDPAVEHALDDYRQAEEVHAELSRRAANARMELASAQAAFGYRYIVTQPPILPRRAVSPRPASFLGSGVIAALFMAILFAVLADLRAGRVIEAWQIERLLDVRVLGEFKEP